MALSLKDLGCSTLQETDEIKRARWHHYFDLDRFETGAGTPSGHKFGRFFASDGISISVKMSRRKVSSRLQRA